MPGVTGIPPRAQSLDVLRGFAIFMMILSGSVVAGILPAWMSHAQCPPSTGAFDPTVYGITWVDLVFPFFLFAMGASFPFAVASRMERGDSRLRLILDALWRSVKLAYFALYLYHVNPWVLSGGGRQTVADWLITIFGFAALFAVYLRVPSKIGEKARIGIHLVGITLTAALMLWSDCRNGGSFNFYQSNIIILVLANMAAFGTIIYVLTTDRPWARVAVLPFLMGILLCKTFDGSWQHEVYVWTPVPWLYRFDYLKYLFIVIPGTFAGEYLRDWIHAPGLSVRRRHNPATAVVLLLSSMLIVINVWLLFERVLLVNFLVSLVLVVTVGFAARRMPSASGLLARMVCPGGYLLILGLVFEAFDGGVRKDPSTFNYYFITTGLAFYCLAVFVILCDVYNMGRFLSPLSLAGKNPMIAYAAPHLLVMPLLNLCHAGDAFTYDFFSQSSWLGFLHGLVVTALSILAAAFFSRLKWFWRT